MRRLHHFAVLLLLVLLAACTSGTPPPPSATYRHSAVGRSTSAALYRGRSGGCSSPAALGRSRRSRRIRFRPERFRRSDGRHRALAARIGHPAADRDSAARPRRSGSGFVEPQNVGGPKMKKRRFGSLVRGQLHPRTCARTRRELVARSSCCRTSRAALGRPHES